jgi:protein-S-isoprenylcysteine O-methyltransferase Ste14
MSSQAALEVGVQPAFDGNGDLYTSEVPPKKRRRKADKKAAILTPIDEAVVVLLVCLGAISFPLEVNCGDSF